MTVKAFLLQSSMDSVQLYRVWLVLLAVCGFVAFVVWAVNSLASRELKKRKPVQEVFRMDVPWEKQFRVADAVIRELIPTLPAVIRKEAEIVPFILEKWPPEGGPPNILGLYLGQYHPGVISASPGPIKVFVGTHYEFCEREGIDFAEEIRRTYLHELGHHLGLDEFDLEERGIG